MDKIKKLLLENKAWSQGKLIRNPEYFKDMAVDQKPEFLWIGCSDSRVDPSELTNTGPGEMFVHRNIANLVKDEDLNLQSVIQFAVEVLKINHIIVCGHYNCGGVKAAFGPLPLKNVDQWISSIRENLEFHKVEVSRFTTETEKVNFLVERNVMSQVKRLLGNPIIQASQKERAGYPIVHGWVYDLHNGILKPIQEKM